MEILNSVGLSLVAFIFVLGVMIFIHELGHHLVAKWLGIRVEVFALGFGKRLFGFRYGDTDYRVNLLPLGGYVKMAGENYDDQLTGNPDEFLSRPKMHRLAVAVAGPIMNIALALTLVTVNLMIGVPVMKHLREAAVIGYVLPDSPARTADLQVKDTILAIDGEPTPTWQDAELLISASPNQELELTIERGESRLIRTVTTTTRQDMEIGTIGVGPYLPFVIAEVEAGSPAAEAGLQPGDEVVRISSGEEVAFDFGRGRELIAASQGRPLTFEVRRGQEMLEFTLVAEEMDGVFRVGTSVPNLVELERFGFVQAVTLSIERNYRLTRLTFDILGKILTGRTSMRTLSGPIEIARFSGRAASMGMLQLLGFMALVSLQLGILNLLPIPILDGGVIALLAVEGLIRRDLSLKAKERIFQVGFIFLILLMGVVIFNDIAKNIPG